MNAADFPLSQKPNRESEDGSPTRLPHPMASREKRLSVFAQQIRPALPEKVEFVSTTRCRDESLKVPPYVRVELTQETLAHLCSLWVCLLFAGGNEIHQWNVESFGFLREADADRDDEPIVEIHLDGQLIRTTGTLPDVDFEGLHACVFSDGDVSFYLMGPGDTSIHMASMFDLNKYWDPSWF